MSRKHPTGPDIANLPKEPVDKLTRPFSQFLRIEAAGGAILLLFTIAALILSNSSLADVFEQVWETSIGLKIGSIEYTRSLRDWINNRLMTLFFFLVALELKREIVLGELNDPRMAALSIAAALGGMAVPATIFFALQIGQPGQQGWGVVMATDTALVIGCLALLGPRIPHALRVFMLSLAIVDDIGAILVVAIGYSNDLDWGALTLAAAGFAAIRAMTTLGIRGFPLYFLVGGAAWLAVDASGVHATITGVILGLMTPARRWVSNNRLYAILKKVVAHSASHEDSEDTEDRRSLQVAAIAARETLSPIERLLIALHPWVGFLIMPLFAFANAGLTLSADDLGNSLTVTVFAGFALGKPLGILLFSWLAVSIQIADRPKDLSWRMIAGGGLLAGIGFTMALFMANLAFDSSLIDSAKLGIFLASVFSAIAGLALLRSAPADKGILERKETKD